MDIELSRMVMMVAGRCREEMAALVPILKEHCSESEREEVSVAIATIVYDLREEVMNKMFKKFPKLEAEYEANKKKYGRTYY